MNRFAEFKMRAALLAGALGLITSSTALSQPGPEPERCLRLNTIDRTEIIDERHIVFYLRNGDIYYNELAHRCGGLRKNDTIMYRPTLNQLCNLDFITVLDSTGFGFMQGPSCGLGDFYPTEEAGVAKLKEQAEIQRQLSKKQN